MDWLKHELLVSWHYEEDDRGNSYPVYVFATQPMPIELSFNYNKIKQNKKLLYHYKIDGIGLKEIMDEEN